MFDFSILSWLGIGGISTAVLLGVAGYFLGAKAVVETVLPPVVQGIVTVCKALWAGFQGLIDTVSDLMMVILLISATWFATSMHYKMEIKDLNFVHKQQLSKCRLPDKPQEEGRYWPFNW